MRTRIIVALATAAVMAGCREQAAEQKNSATALKAAASNAAPSGRTNAVLGPSVSGEQAKTLMHERHEGMEDIGDAFKLVGRETKADTPDTAALREAAATIATLADKSSGWFPPGTGPNAGKTRARAEIWQKPEDFAAKDEVFQDAARVFKAAADSGDVAAIRARAGELGKACKACHDLYRAEEDKHE